jgi:transcriptional regulator with XRE-family HTH domain
MSKATLHTYLRTHRKRSGLSQDEVAFLTGAESGATVCRHEKGRRTLWLADAFAYEALFGEPASVLFPGEYEKSRALIEERAIFLLGKLTRSGDTSSATRHKRFFLEKLVQRVRT